MLPVGKVMTRKEGMKWTIRAPIGAWKGLVEDTKSGKGRVPCLAISWIIRACATDKRTKPMLWCTADLMTYVTESHNHDVTRRRSCDCQRKDDSSDLWPEDALEEKCGDQFLGLLDFVYGHGEEVGDVDQ